jgi:hypothetical protein
MKCCSLQIKLFSRTAAVLCLLIIATCISKPTHAQETRQIQVDILGKSEPATAVGLILTADSVVEYPKAKIEKGPRGNYFVSFSVPVTDIKSDSVAMGLVLSAQGEALFTNTKTLNDRESLEAIAAIPSCEGEPLRQVGLSGQVALLNQLVDIRTKLRNVARNKIAATLNGPLLEKLNKLERGFGLGRETELDPGLPPLELVDRLSRIRAAVRNWDSKSIKESGEPKPTNLNEQLSQP